MEVLRRARFIWACLCIIVGGAQNLTIYLLIFLYLYFYLFQSKNIFISR